MAKNGKFKKIPDASSYMQRKYVYTIYKLFLLM